MNVRLCVTRQGTHGGTGLLVGTRDDMNGAHTCQSGDTEASEPQRIHIYSTYTSDAQINGNKVSKNRVALKPLDLSGESREALCHDSVLQP